MASKKAPDNVFGSLRMMAEALDHKLESLEAQVLYGLGRGSNSGYSADIADDTLDEVKEMTKHAEALAQRMSQENSNMEAFIAGIILNASEMEDTVKQVEAVAAQYGYIPQERKGLQEAYEDFLASGKSPREEEDDENENQDQESKSEVAKSKTVVDSPNLLTIGLTRKTLAKLGYRFKEDLNEDSQEPLVAKSLKPTIIDEKDMVKEYETVQQDEGSDSENDSPQISILKPSKWNQNQNQLPSPNFSLVEISPGLVVKRPSSRITPKNICDTTTEDSEATSPDASTKPEARHCDQSTPPLPSFKTSNWKPNAHQSPMAAKGHNDPKRGRTPVVERKQTSPETPPTPDLQTMDLRKLLQAADLKGANSSKVSETRDVLRPAASYQSVRNDHRPSNSEAGSSDSPTMPDLKTVDVSRLIRSLHMEDMSKQSSTFDDPPDGSNRSTQYYGGRYGKENFN